MTSAYWPEPPVCFLWRVGRRFSTGLGDGLAVGHLRLADGGVDLELAQHAVDQHLEVQLAHAGDDGLAGLLVGADLEGRVLLGERERGPWPSCPGRPWSWARRPRGSPGSGNSSSSSTIGLAGSQSVSPVLVFLKPMPATMSPAKTRVDGPRGRWRASRACGRCAPCCLVRALRTWPPLLELAAVDAEVGELAHVGVGHDLERQGRERLVVVGLALERLVALEVHALRPAGGRAATAGSRRRRRAGAARPCS